MDICRQCRVLLEDGDVPGKVQKVIDQLRELGATCEEYTTDDVMGNHHVYVTVNRHIHVEWIRLRKGGKTIWQGDREGKYSSPSKLLAALRPPA